MKYWFAIGGIALNVIAVFNLVSLYLKIGLSPILVELLKFYKNLFHPIADVILYTLDTILFFIKFPDIPKDIVIIYVIFAATFVRGLSRIIRNRLIIPFYHLQL